MTDKATAGKAGRHEPTQRLQSTMNAGNRDRSPIASTMRTPSHALAEQKTSDGVNEEDPRRFEIPGISVRRPLEPVRDSSRAGGWLSVRRGRVFPPTASARA